MKKPLILASSILSIIITVTLLLALWINRNPTSTSQITSISSISKSSELFGNVYIINTKNNKTLKVEENNFIKKPTNNSTLKNKIKVTNTKFNFAYTRTGVIYYQYEK